MTLRVDLEDVPFEILEIVKARIMANRRRREQEERARRRQRQQALLSRFGIQSSWWRRRTAAFVDDGISTSFGPSLGHFWWRGHPQEDLLNDGVTAQGRTIGAGQDLVVGFRRRFTFYCGNGSQSLSFEYGHQPGQVIPAYGGSFGSSHPALIELSATGFHDLIVLPAGGGSSIVLFLAVSSRTITRTTLSIPTPGSNYVDLPAHGTPVYDPDYPAQAGYAYFSQNPQLVTQCTVLKKCFVVSNTAIREIAIPSVLSAIVDAILPPPSLVSQRITTSLYQPATVPYDLVYDADVLTTSFQSYGSSWSPYGFGPLDYSRYDRSIFTPITPQVFDALTGSAESQPPSQLLYDAYGDILQAMPNSLRWLMQDTSSGLYEPVRWAPIASTFAPQSASLAAFNLGQPLRYGQWIAAGIEPTYDVVNVGDYEWFTYNDDDYNKLPSLTLNMSAARPAINDGVLTLYAVSNWEMPGYCRSICRRLGFTDANLAP